MFHHASTDRTPRGSQRPHTAVFESLEQRKLLSGNPFFHEDHNPHDAGATVYIETNNPGTNQNAVLAFQRNPVTGNLKELPGGPFLTGGTGYLNGQELLGPDDSDKEVI